MDIKGQRGLSDDRTVQRRFYDTHPQMSTSKAKKIEEGQCIVSMSVTWLLRCTIILQMVVIGENCLKDTWALPVLFLITACESTIISK